MVFSYVANATAVLTAALFSVSAHSARETLRIQIGKDKTALDTAQLWVDYEKPPEVAHPQGLKWSEQEKDSVWIDGENQKKVRYTHNFLASIGSRKGYGFDHIIFTTSGTGIPQYTAYASFHFPGDTSVSYAWDPAHYQDDPDVYPYHAGLKPGNDMYGQVFRLVGDGSVNLAQGQWAKLLVREAGWTGGDGPTSVHRMERAARAEGWVIHLAPRTVLRVPLGAKGLKVVDVQGRLHWDARNLSEGAPVILPEGLPHGALRYYWISKPG